MKGWTANIANSFLVSSRTEDTYHSALNQPENQPLITTLIKDYHLNCEYEGNILCLVQGAVVGRGAFGTVFRSKQVTQGTAIEPIVFYAMKCINTLHKGDERARAANMEKIAKEAEILQKLNHISIVKYISHSRDDTINLFFIVMEFVDGMTLSKKITCNTQPSEFEMFIWMQQVADALDYLHDESKHDGRILHRDLKPSNVLVSLNGADIKLCDFGLACEASAGAVGTTNRRVGTRNYFSFEKIAGLSYQNGCDDMWALGCILVELLTRRRLMQPLQLPEPGHVSYTWWGGDRDPAYREQLLQMAAIVSPFLGGEILPGLLHLWENNESGPSDNVSNGVPTPHRTTAAELLQTLTAAEPGVRESHAELQSLVARVTGMQLHQARELVRNNLPELVQLVAIDTIQPLNHIIMQEEGENENSGSYVCSETGGENDTGMRHSGSESDEDFEAQQQQQQQQQHKGRPPPPPAKVRFTDENDDEDGDDYADKTVVGGGNNADDSDKDDEGTGASSRPVARTNTGNPLKDMLNAQVAAKGRGAGALPNPAATTSARTHSVSSAINSAGNWNNSNNSNDSNNKNSSAAAAPAKSSIWDDDNSDEDSTAGGNNSSAADAFRNKANLADIIGRSHGKNAAKPPASTADAAVCLKGDPEADSDKEYKEDNEDDGGDLFAANDDPFGLFVGGAKTSAFAKVRKVQLYLFLCFCFKSLFFNLFTCTPLYRNQLVVALLEVCLAV
jgi:serine/threonine protein kinase